MLQPKNQFILIPEFSILKILENSIKFIREDLQKQIDEFNDEELSWLWYLTQGVGVQRLEIFKQAKKLFLIDDPEDPKRLNITLGYPQELKGATAICIVHAGEQSAQNALSTDESPYKFEEYVVDKNESDAWRNTYGRRYTSTYQIMITGDSTNEVIIVYNILKSMFITFMGSAQLSMAGFENAQVTGNDLQLRGDMSKNMFAKALNFKFEYEFRVPDTERQQYINSVIFKEIILDK